MGLIWRKSPQEQKECLIDTFQSQIQMDICFEQKQIITFYPPGKDWYCRNNEEESLVLFSRLQIQGRDSLA